MSKMIPTRTSSSSKKYNSTSADFITEEGNQVYEARIKELEQSLEQEKKVFAHLQVEKEQHETSLKGKIRDLEGKLQREQKGFQTALTTMLNAKQPADVTRQQMEMMEELQALNESLKSQVSQLQEDLETSEENAFQVQSKAKVELEALKSTMQSLQQESAQLKSQVGSKAQSGAQVNDSGLQRFEQENKALKTQLTALEAENTYLKKKSSADSDKERKEFKDRVSRLEAEKTALAQELEKVKSEQGGKAGKVTPPAAASTAAAHAQQQAQMEQLKVEMDKVSSQLISCRSQLAAKDKELSELASSAEVEIGKLEAKFQEMQKSKAQAEDQVNVLQEEITKLRNDMARQTAREKGRLEQDEHYQRAMEAAKQLLKQKKISKAEYDQVIKAAQEASRVWNE